MGPLLNNDYPYFQVVYEDGLVIWIIWLSLVPFSLAIVSGGRLGENWLFVLILNWWLNSPPCDPSAGCSGLGLKVKVEGESRERKCEKTQET